MLKLKIDSLDKVDEKYHDLYKKDGDGWKLEVSGVEDVTPLKRTIEALREEKSNLNIQVGTLKTENTELKKAPAKKKGDEGDFESLYKGSKEQNQTLQQQLETTRKENLATLIVANLGLTGKSAKILMPELLDNFITYDSENGVASIKKSSGFETVEEVSTHVKKEYDFIKFDNQSSGGGAIGDGDRSASTEKEIKRSEYDNLLAVEQDKFLIDGGKVVDD